MSRTQTRVYVVDDDSQLHASLTQWLLEAAYTSLAFASGKSFLAAYPRLPAGCIVLDADMAGMSGLELQRRLISAGCRWPVIVLAADDGGSVASHAMENGAVAFLLKPVRRGELLAALQRGEQYLCGALDAIPDPEVLQRISTLTPHEREVLLGILDGRFNKEIAAARAVSESAVKSCRGKLRKKLKVRTVAELVLLAVRAGLAGRRP